MRKILLTIAILLLPAMLAAQSHGGGGNVFAQQKSGAFSGSCSFNYLGIDNAGPGFYACLGNSWTKIGGGTGTVTVVGAGSLTSTAIVTGGGTTTIQTPSATSTLDSSGNAVFAGSVNATSLSAGTAPTACGSATACFAGTEASTAGTPTAGQAYMRFSSTAHNLLFSFNNGAEGPLPANSGGTGAATLTGPIKGNGTSAMTAAVASDIVGLFSTCSGTQYLGADGACHNVSGVSETFGNTIFTTCAGGGVSRYIPIVGGNSNCNGTTEANTYTGSTIACTNQILTVVTAGTQPNDAGMTLTLRAGSATPSGSPVVTVPANAAAGVFHATGTASIAQYAGIDILEVNSSASASATIATIALTCY